MSRSSSLLWSLGLACPGFRRPPIPWIHANKPVTDNPTRLDGLVNLSLTPPLASPSGYCHANGQIEWAALLPAC